MKHASALYLEAANSATMRAENIDTFREGPHGKSFIIAVNAEVVFFGERKGDQSVSLHVVKTQLCRICRAGRLKRQHRSVSKLRCRDFVIVA